MSKIEKGHPKGKVVNIEEARTRLQTRQASPIENCTDATGLGNSVPKGTAQTLADPPRKEKARDRLTLPLTATYWVHVKPDGTEIQFDKEPMPRGANPPIPNLRVWVVGHVAREYTVTFNRSELCEGCIDGRRVGDFLPGKHRKDCTGWRSVPVKPPGEGWIRSNYVHEEIRPLLKTDRPSTLWSRHARTKGGAS
jgi:hypothetical protein